DLARNAIGVRQPDATLAGRSAGVEERQVLGVHALTHADGMHGALGGQRCEAGDGLLQGLGRGDAAAGQVSGRRIVLGWIAIGKEEGQVLVRSEERRVGKERRSRWSESGTGKR